MSAIKNYSPGRGASALPPIEKDLADGQTLEIFNRTKMGKRHALISIQNIGTGVIRYGMDYVPTIDAAHGGLAASLVAKDFTGALVTFDKTIEMESFTILAVGATRVCAYVALRNDVID